MLVQWHIIKDTRQSSFHNVCTAIGIGCALAYQRAKVACASEISRKEALVKEFAITYRPLAAGEEPQEHHSWCT